MVTDTETLLRDRARGWTARATRPLARDLVREIRSEQFSVVAAEHLANRLAVILSHEDEACAALVREGVFKTA